MARLIFEDDNLNQISIDAAAVSEDKGIRTTVTKIAGGTINTGLDWDASVAAQAKPLVSHLSTNLAAILATA